MKVTKKKTLSIHPHEMRISVHFNSKMGPLDEGPKSKSGTSRLNLHGTILERKSIGSNQKKTKKESS
jgi:hypothetical protein